MNFTVHYYSPPSTHKSFVSSVRFLLKYFFSTPFILLCFLSTLLTLSISSLYSPSSHNHPSLSSIASPFLPFSLLIFPCLISSYLPFSFLVSSYLILSPIVSPHLSTSHLISPHLPLSPVSPPRCRRVRRARGCDATQLS